MILVDCFRWCVCRQTTLSLKAGVAMILDKENMADVVVLSSAKIDDQSKCKHLISSNNFRDSSWWCGVQCWTVLQWHFIFARKYLTWRMKNVVKLEMMSFLKCPQEIFRYQGCMIEKVKPNTVKLPALKNCNKETDLRRKWNQQQKLE